MHKRFLRESIGRSTSNLRDWLQKTTSNSIFTCPAGSELSVKRLVAVELWLFHMFHVETSEVAVEVQWSDVV